MSATEASNTTPAGSTTPAPIPFADLPFVEECMHMWDDGHLQVPLPNDSVYKDECGYCFHCNEDKDGVLVCLKCWRGFCRRHVDRHVATHSLYLAVHQQEPEPPKEITEYSQLGGGQPIITTSIVCLGCNGRLAEGSGITEEPVSAIKNAVSPQKQDAVNDNAWALKQDCMHIHGLQQLSSTYTSENKVKQLCATCGSDSNCWMCMTCGQVGCGRKETGGNEHAIAHKESTGHPLVVKLGSITPTAADIYCYACDDAVADFDLNEHLAYFGIDRMTAKKTDKSLAEMELDRSAQFDYSAITEGGAKLQKVSGPGFTGMRNFGNQCYMASVMQVLFSIPAFQQRFNDGGRHVLTCTKTGAPYSCAECQVTKLATALASSTEYEKGITARDFKKLVSNGHAEFSTMKQQDAMEYLTYFLDYLEKKDTEAGTPYQQLKSAPYNCMRTMFQERTKCLACDKVRYRHSGTSYGIGVNLVSELFPPGTNLQATPENPEDRPRTTLEAGLRLCDAQTIECRCDECGQMTVYQQDTKLLNFPDVLVVNVHRFAIDMTTYQSKKLDLFVTPPPTMDINFLRASGPQPGENLFSAANSRPVERQPAAPAQQPQQGGTEVDELALVQLISMGIEDKMARFALKKNANNVENAVNWIFSNPGVVPEEETAQQSSSQAQGSASTAAVPGSALSPEEQLAQVVTDGSSVYELFGMISHCGSNAQVGHYVAHVKKDGQWFIFDDEKVGKSENPPFDFAYVYLYRRAK